MKCIACYCCSTCTCIRKSFFNLLVLVLCLYHICSSMNGSHALTNVLPIQIAIVRGIVRVVHVLAD